MRWLGGILLACGLVLPAQAANFATLGPQVSAAQILAARSGATPQILRLVYSVYGGAYGASRTVSIDLAADYNDVRDVIYDYRLRRVITLDPAHRTFSNDSLYAFVDSRVAETHNRRSERGLLTSAKTRQSGDLVDPFWVQSELHVMDAADPLPVVSRVPLPGGGARFSYKGNEVARYTLSATTLSDSESAAFARLLQTSTTLHPSIIIGLVSTRRLPQRLVFTAPPARRQRDEVWDLRSVSRLAAPYPLTTDYAAKPLAGTNAASTALAGLMPLILDSIAGHAGGGPRSIAQYRAAIEDSLQKKAGLQASLRVFEAVEQYGQQALDCPDGAPQPCHTPKDIFTQAQSDPRLGVVIQSLTLERTDPNQAIGLRQGLRRDDLVNRFVLDGFNGNAMVAAGRMSEALPLLVNEVRGDPYIGGYYKDLGDLFRQSFAANLAWLCYDLGRALPGGPTAPVISAMGDTEAQLALKYPQFF